MRLLGSSLALVLTLGCSSPAPDSTSVLLSELRQRFHEQPDSISIAPGARVRLVYVDPQHPAAPIVQSYATDSTEFRRAFDEAAWLWTRHGRRAGVDTISVTRIQRAADNFSGHTRQYFFYPAQLEHPNDPPILGRPDGRSS